MTKELLSEGEIWKEITNLFGEDTLFHPEQISKVDQIKSQSPGLDWAMGGGFPMGRMIQLAGKESAGKSFMSLMAMKEWLSLDPENCCAYIDCEYTFNTEWATTLGLDVNRILLIKTNQAQRIFSGLLGSYKKNKTTGKLTKLPGLLDMITAGSRLKHKVDNKVIDLNLGKMGVIVLDSLSVLEVPQETESEIGKQNIALVARFLSNELKKLTPQISAANVAFIVINQIRMAIGNMYGDPETTSGGRAWKHAASLMVQVAPINNAESILLDQNGNKIGHKVRAKITKNKISPPGKTVEFFTNFLSGIVKQEDELLNLGCMYGLIERPNNRSYVMDGKKITSRELALEYIKEHQSDLEEKIRAAYLSGQKPVAKVESEDEENPFDASDSEEEGEEVVEIG